MPAIPPRKQWLVAMAWSAASGPEQRRSIGAAPCAIRVISGTFLYRDDAAAPAFDVRHATPELVLPERFMTVHFLHRLSWSIAKRPCAGLMNNQCQQQQPLAYLAILLLLARHIINARRRRVSGRLLCVDAC